MPSQDEWLNRAHSGITTEQEGLDRPVAQSTYRSPDPATIYLYPGPEVRNSHPEHFRDGWRWTHLMWPAGTMERIAPGPDMLDDFVALRDAPAEQILVYAQRWGRLGVCQRGHSPRERRFDPYESMSHILVALCREVGIRPEEEIPNKVADALGDHIRYDPVFCCLRNPSELTEEYLSSWRRYAREFWAIIEIAWKLHQNESESSAMDDWLIIEDQWHWRDRTVPWDPDDGPLGSVEYYSSPSLIESTAGPYEAFERALRDLLLAADVAPMLLWEGASPQVVLSGETLFGALVVQLLFAVAWTQGFAVCSACGRPFGLRRDRRRPRAGERCYCLNPYCQRAKYSAASRAYRQKKRVSASGLNSTKSNA